MKWEYKIEPMRMPSSFVAEKTFPDQYAKLLKEHGDTLSHFGKDGWEVFHVVNSWFYMKRPDPHQRSER